LPEPPSPAWHVRPASPVTPAPAATGRAAGRASAPSGASWMYRKACYYPLFGTSRASEGAHALLQPVPAAHRVARRAAPGLDRAVGGGLLLVGVAQRHPVAALLQHRVQVVNAAELVAQLRGAHLDDQGGRVAGLIAPGLEVGLSRRRGQDPRVLGGAGPGGAAAHRVAPLIE